jgi:hypothetical protein
VDGKRLEVRIGWVMLGACVVGWPLSALTIARGEPPVILGLSWLAIILNAVGYLKTSRVHRDQDE